MFSIVETAYFSEWMNGLKDHATRIRLARRLDKARRGNLGDVKPVGFGVFEMREVFGPGWPMYYTERAGSLIIMLGGGDKSSQGKDIAKVQMMAKEFK